MQTIQITDDKIIFNQVIEGDDWDIIRDLIEYDINTTIIVFQHPKTNFTITFDWAHNDDEFILNYLYAKWYDITFKIKDLSVNQE